MSDIRVKRAYESADKSDGARYLVDRLWPRGVSKEKADLTDWLKSVAPSDELRQRYHEGALNWPNFVKAYEAELGKDEAAEGVQTLKEAASKGRITLVFASKQTEQNNATALRDYLLKG
ncbi:DUF488 domain-containing protein [Henriciella sp.]|uniref:DUF488 domain-containing protein n=1 Tax=Henriciella sp. TaxID=1968823 RepID=UPI00262F6F7A|nr:DUF488 family protein [Henriciella sp.]